MSSSNITDDFSNWFPAREMSLVSELKCWRPPVSRPTQLASPPVSPPHFAPAVFGNACLVVFCIFTLECMISSSNDGVLLV